MVIRVMTQHDTMLQWNLLYTGVTRGKQLVVLAGQKKAVAIAVRNVSAGGVVETGRMVSSENVCELRSWKDGTMNEAHKIWIEQCEAAETVRARYGLNSAFDYIVAEKLMNFAEAACRHRDFAQELPRFISKVRTMFTPEEMTAQLTRIERERNKKNEDVLDEDFQGEDDLLRENPAKIAERDRQFATIKELLTATTLGTA